MNTVTQTIQIKISGEPVEATFTTAREIRLRKMEYVGSNRIFGLNVFRAQCGKIYVVDTKN
jgi:hypothetical protein